MAQTPVDHPLDVLFGQLISWGLVYYTFPLFIVPMEQELGWARSSRCSAPCRPDLLDGRHVLDPGGRLDRSRPRDAC